MERSREAAADGERPGVFTMRGRDWTLLPEVFAPPYSASTDAAMELLGFVEGPQVPRQGSFLEVGCGTGIIAVSAALAGCDRVLATDINEHAVENAALNAQRHGVAGRVSSRHSDLFDALDPDQRFDTVYWHSNFVLAPADYAYESVHECAYVDPGYAAHRRYLIEAPLRTTPGGSALLHFSDRGDLAGLHAIADESGRELDVLSSIRIREGRELVEHMLIEVSAAPVSAPPVSAAPVSAAPVSAAPAGLGAGLPGARPRAAAAPRTTG
ncbi:methyltransferase domain-containing protein [Streptomyces sp. LHD-70]|uniref:methyltransferase domain-containing protein n=1 Tax=Streptomyces sp. LHD-70 TaxID=3072140 RepID=UPI00280C5A08|nr:methyltransferase domain-containing protein [Streptomyces sp. LHD-70]MDQ8707235.1 methyltransferase domain-containing protein [Streptomyces sp. LHD-70]